MSFFEAGSRLVAAASLVLGGIFFEDCASAFSAPKRSPPRSISLRGVDLCRGRFMLGL